MCSVRVVTYGPGRVPFSSFRTGHLRCETCNEVFGVDLFVARFDVFGRLCEKLAERVFLFSLTCQW